MKKYFSILLLIFVCSSCVENAIDSKQEDNSPRTLESLLTKSSGAEQEDRLTMMNTVQSDVDNFMMGRVLVQDGVYVLAIKREDATFLGVPSEVYDWYIEYVARLNDQ